MTCAERSLRLDTQSDTISDTIQVYLMPAVAPTQRFQAVLAPVQRCWGLSRSHANHPRELDRHETAGDSHLYRSSTSTRSDRSDRSVRHVAVCGASALAARYS